MRSTTNRPKNLLRGLVGFGLMLFAMTGAYAQVTAAAGAPQIQQYLSATPSGDLSVAVFTSVLGGFFTSPFTQVGGPNTAIGTAFLMFNAGIFAIGMVWVTYGVGAGIIQTAHEGVVLGKRFNPLWMPIRMTMGIGGLAPIFSGYSLSQAVMMFLASLGIGLCNFMWTGTVGQLSAGNPLVSPALIAPSTKGAAYLPAAQALFADRICEDSWNSNQASVAYAMQGQSVGLTPVTGGNVPVPTGGQPIVESTTPSTGGSKTAKSGIWFDGPNTPALCGAVWVENDGKQGRSSGSMTGFRVASVNYAAVTANVQTAYLNGFKAFSSKVKGEADNWWNQYVAYENRGVVSGGANAGPPPIPMDTISAAAQDYALAVSSATASQTPSLTGQAQGQMMAYGWFGAGGWYATMSELQSAVNQAAMDVTLQIANPSPQAADLSSQSFQALKVVATAFNNVTTTTSYGSNFGATPTGNDSWGQAIVTKLMEIASAGTPGSLASSASGGSMSGTSAGVPLVDPIMAMKNLGDYFMTFGEAAALLGPASKMANWAASMASAVPGVSFLAGGVTTVVKAVGSVFEGTLVGGIKIATVLFYIGAIMSLYIPMIPFIHWWSGIVQYVTVVFEGLVASPLWAFAHLDANGEGLGHRTERGYVFAMNVLFRPALMLLGFLLASGVMLVLGTVLFALFVPAMANMQGNSITGLPSIIGFVVIYMVLNIALVGAVFNMITVIPDQVLGWVGNMANSHLGKEVEGKVNSMFVMATSSGREIMFGGKPKPTGKPGRADNGTKPENR